MENPGVRSFIERDLEWVNGLDLVNIVNLAATARRTTWREWPLLNDHPLDLLELNISCPNTKNGCMSFGLQADIARELVRKVRAVCRHKLVVKLSPNAENITAWPGPARRRGRRHLPHQHLSGHGHRPEAAQTGL